jgi:hypothetical protein
MRCHLSMSTVLVGVVLGVCGMRAQAREPKPTSANDRPLWEIDLRQFGYERWLRRSTRPLPLVVDFTDIDHLAVGWIRPDGASVAGRNDTYGPEPAHLNVVILDAKTGQKQSRTEWPTSARYFSAPLFFGIPDGRLLICSDNVLRLLSPTLEVVREQELPDRASCVNVAFQHSPSRRTLLVSILSEHSRRMELLDVGTLAVLSSWTEERAASAPFRGILSISDHWLAGYCGEPNELCLRRFDKGWQPFPNGFDAQMDKGQHIPVSFVSDEILVVERKTTGIVAVDGTVLFRIAPPEKHFLLLPATSAGGARFALIEDRFRGLKSEPLDMYPFGANDRALVYGIKDRRSIFSLKLKGTSPWTPWDVHDNYLALSPNGTHLAVLSDGVLKIYRLPSDGAEQH